MNIEIEYHDRHPQTGTPYTVPYFSASTVRGIMIINQHRSSRLDHLDRFVDAWLDHKAIRFVIDKVNDITYTPDGWRNR